MRHLKLLFIVALVCLSHIGWAQERVYQKNNIHDETRAKPVRVIPGEGTTTAPPSDAIVLFDGSNLNAWEVPNFKIIDSAYMVADKGGLTSKESFGDIQFHVEWRMNDTLKIKGQSGGNSGVYFMSKYEVQILESFVNETYADGQAGAVYGQYPPLVNAATPQGNWNSYDIIFTAPVYENDKFKEKARVTVFHNGVLVQNNQAYEGPSLYQKVTSYPETHPEKGPIHIQYHNDPVEYRNMWVREITEQKQTEKIAWENPFPKGELNTTYTTSEVENPEGNKLYSVKDNSIEVLYDWVGEEAPFGIITTNKEYSYYNLELEYKWGKRKFAPRAEAKRDAGILFHIKEIDEVWPTCLECQVQEGDTGDLWVIKGPKVIAIELDGNEKILDSKVKDYMHNKKYKNHEMDGWNAVRVEVRGSESARFYENGHLVNEIKNMLDENGNPLTKGRISLQAEGAEIIYRNIRIQEINK